MSKLIVAVFVLALVEIARGARPLTEAIREKMTPHFQLRDLMRTRESGGCSLPNYPSHCVETLDDFEAILAMTDFGAIDTNALSATMDELCSDECIGPEIDYYECTGQDDFADIVNNGFCGEHEGTNCYVRWIEGVNSNSVTVILLSCLPGENCTEDCQTMLQDTSDYLGCCATSFYTNQESPFYYLITPEQFGNCSVDLGEQCPPAYSGGVSVFGSGLSVLLVAAAAVVISALF